MQSWVWKAIELFVSRVTDSDSAVHINHTRSMATASIKFNGGTYHLPEGIMKSGYHCTLLYNSLTQLCLHSLAIIRSGLLETGIVVMGDDTLQEVITSPLYKQELELTGCIVKNAVIRSHGEPVSFAVFYLVATLLVLCTSLRTCTRRCTWVKKRMILSLTMPPYISKIVVYLTF